MMVKNKNKTEKINVLASEVNWAWPQALKTVFRPSNVNLMVAENVNEFVRIMRQRRIHTAIIDMDSEISNGLATVKIIRMEYPTMPCILLTTEANDQLLEEALRLRVFSVIEKPVDMTVLQRQLDRLFTKKFSCRIFHSRQDFS